MITESRETSKDTQTERQKIREKRWAHYRYTNIPKKGMKNKVF